MKFSNLALAGSLALAACGARTELEIDRYNVVDSNNSAGQAGVENSVGKSGASGKGSAAGMGGKAGMAGQAGEAGLGGNAGVSGMAGKGGSNVCPDLVSAFKVTPSSLEADQDLQIFATLNESAITVSLDITQNQQVIRTMVVNNLFEKSGSHVFYWSQNNNSGQQVPNGEYEARLVAIKDGCTEVEQKSFFLNKAPVCEVNVSMPFKQSTAQYAGTSAFEMACWEFETATDCVKPVLHLLALKRVGPGNEKSLVNNALYAEDIKVSDYENINAETQLAVFNNLNFQLSSGKTSKICIKSDLALTGIGQVDAFQITEASDVVITDDLNVKVNGNFPERGPDVLIAG
ncbi:hypothetical protein IT412_03325, partial [Candidatus Peregrinibacteria bacterium]|nr:hypothetical protein [Candidatus Peregrinibacteria bacterium]